MAKTAKKSKLTWNRNGPIAAQLFRDLYFKKYVPNEKGKFNIAEIYNDPERNYKETNQTSFPKNLSNIYDRVKSYKATGAGLGTEAFRRLVRLNEPPPPEDRNPSSDIDEDEDEDDSDFDGDSDLEDDITLEGFEDLESAFEEIKLSGKISEKKSKPKPKLPQLDDESEMKFVFEEPDGRLGFVFQLPSGYDGSIELSEDKKTIFIKKVKHQWMYDAERIYERKGLNANNVHVVSLQAVLDTQKKKDITAMGQNPDSYNGEITVKTTLFELKKPVAPYFIDEFGRESDEFWFDGSDKGEWIYFWLKYAISNRPVSAKMNKNRRRAREHTNEDGGRRQHDYDGTTMEDDDYSL